MFSALDAYAFKILLGLYGFLGVQEIPKEHNSNWKINEKWNESVNQTYRLILESETINKQCSANKNSYIVFPQTYMGKHEIYSGNTLVYTNVIGSDWSMFSMLSRPVVSCKSFNSSYKIILVTTSYIKYFSSISYYPYIVTNYPTNQFFYDEIFLVSAACAIFLGIIGSILIKKFLPAQETVFYFLKQVFFSALVISHVPGKMFNISLAASHTLIALSIALALLCLILTSIKFSKTIMNSIMFVFGCFVIFIFLSYGNKNLTQVCIIILIPIAIASTAILFLRKVFDYRSEKKLTLILYLLIFLFTVHDCLWSQIYRDGFVHLSGITFIASFITFAKLLEQVNYQENKLINANVHLKNEIETIKRLTNLYHSYREIIHDVKSPITALLFFLKDETIKKDDALLLAKRLKLILSRFDEKRINSLADWHPAIALIENIMIIFFQKQNIHPKFSLKMNKKEFDGVSVFCDPVDFLIIVEELFDNAIKYSDGIVHVVADADSFFEICFSNKYFLTNQMVSSDMPIGQGLGLGRENIEKKMKKINGNFFVSVEGEYYAAKLRFAIR